MSLRESLQEIQAWEYADSQRLERRLHQVELDRAVGDAEIKELGLDAAELLAESGVPSAPSICVAISFQVSRTTRRVTVHGPAGWTLPSTGFGVSAEGQLVQLWSNRDWRPARCWHPSDWTDCEGGRPKLALWPHHDRVSLDAKHAYRPLEEVVAHGINRLQVRLAD